MFNLTPLDRLLLLCVMAVVLKFVLAGHCQLHTALHNHSPVIGCAVVRVTAGQMSCFRLTFKPREARVTRFKPDGVFIPYIPFKLFDYKHIETYLKEKLSFKSLFFFFNSISSEDCRCTDACPAAYSGTKLSMKCQSIVYQDGFPRCIHSHYLIT